MLTAAGTFVAATLVIFLVGPRMARTADGLARATGMGGALFGVVFLALATDLPEIALTPTAVLSGSPKVAIGGLLGSAAAQLVLVGVLDVAFRSANLHGEVPLRAALGQCGLMISVLAVPLIMSAGGPTIGAVGAGTVLLPLAYLAGLAAIRGLGRQEEGAGSERPGNGSESDDPPFDLRSSWLRFVGFAALLAGAGVALESATETIGSSLGLGQTAAGALIAGAVTWLPEMVTAVAAIRVGAVGLAVGDLVGSSALDVSLLALADAFYVDGSIFELIGRPELTLLGVGLALTSLVIIGLARSERRHQAGAAVESYLMLGVYIAGAVILISTAPGTA